MNAAATAAGSTHIPFGRTPCRAAVIAKGVRRSKQYIARKELQKRAKEEYLRRIYETADRVEDDQLVFELQPSSPRVRAELRESEQHAALNQQLAQEIPRLDSWQQLQQFMQQHGDRLNFLNVVALVAHAAALQQAAASSGEDQAPDVPEPVSQLTVLVLQNSSWFQPVHFAAAAVALADLGVCDAAVWDNLTAAAQHKVGAFTFPQLAATLEALAAAGYTPELSWVERSYRQAGKHLHAAEAADIAVLMGAWGEFGYTPRDRLFLNQVKILTRRAFDQRQLSGAELVQLMHGLARMPRYAPNQGWLAAAAKATQHHLQDMTPGAVVDLMLSFVALDFSPPEPWMEAALGRMQQAMQACLNQQQQQPTITTTTSSSRDGSTLGTPPQQEQLLQQQEDQQHLQVPLGLLFLSPLDLQQLAQEQLLMSPALLLDPADTAESQQQQQQQPLNPADSSDMASLQALFDEAGLDTADSMLSKQQVQDGAEQDSLVDADSTLALQAQPQHQQQKQQGDAMEDGPVSPVTRLSSSSATSSSGHSLRWQLLQPRLLLDHLGVLCWCLGRLQYEPNPEWMQLLGQILLLETGPVLPVVPTALRQEVLVDVLVGCLATGYLPVGQLQQQLLAQVLQCIPTMPPESLRRMCQGLVELEKGLEGYNQQPAALAMLLQQQQWEQQQGGAGQGAGSADSTSTSSTSGSILEPLLQYKGAIAAAVAHRQGSILTSSSTAQLADVLAFIAAAGQTPSLDYMTAAVTRAVDKLPDGCPTPAVCTLLWSLACMGFKPHPQLLHQLLATLQRGLHRLSSQDLANTGWALCTLRHRPGDVWLSQYLKEVAAKAPYMESQALTDTLWALACFAAQPDREWLKQVVQVVGARAAAGALSQENGAVVLWALQQLGFQPEQLLPPPGAGAAGVPAAGAVHAAVAGLVRVVQAA